MNDLTETEAALEQDNGFTLDSDGDLNNEVIEPNNTDSATVTEAEETETLEAEKPKEDGFQKRIDKVTADKYAEKRRADELQKWKDEQLAKQAELKKPTLEQHDYDEEAFNKANLDYEIQQGVQSTLAKQKADRDAEKQQQASQQAVASFNERAQAMGKPDFDAKAQAIPNLPAGVANALMQANDGAEMVYHLGSNLDKAAEIASMSPQLAMMELGKLSAQLSAKPEIKLSAAPAPIETLKSGGSLSKERGPRGARYD